MVTYFRRFRAHFGFLNIWNMEILARRNRSQKNLLYEIMVSLYANKEISSNHDFQIEIKVSYSVARKIITNFNTM